MPLYITEYVTAGITPRSTIAAGQEPANATQTVAIGAGSVQSATFQPTTTFVRVATDVICSILFGTNPTATAASPRMAANSAEYFAVEPGRSMRVAAITNV